MEQEYTKANSANLPRINLLTLGEFLASNKDFGSAEMYKLPCKSTVYQL